MDLNSILCAFVGSIIGLLARIFVISQLKLRYYENKINLVNYLATFFLGIIISLDLINKNLFLLFYVGFLGSFSTFSSFIHNLYVLFQRGQFVRLILNYLEIITKSFILFCMGYFLIKIFQKWIKKFFYFY